MRCDSNPHVPAFVASRDLLIVCKVVFIFIHHSIWTNVCALIVSTERWCNISGFTCRLVSRCNVPVCVCVCLQSLSDSVLMTCFHCVPARYSNGLLFHTAAITTVHNDWVLLHVVCSAIWWLPAFLGQLGCVGLGLMFYDNGLYDTHS